MNHHVETSMPWIETGDAPALPADRDPREIISQGVADPLYDIDIFPLTLVNSRIYAFIYRASEADLRRILPDPLHLEDDLVEFWYAVHDNTSMGPYNELGVTVAVSCRGSDGLTYHAGYYPYMWLTQDIPMFAGHEPYGFGKKMAYIVCLEHGGGDDDGYSGFGNDYFNFVLERRGYLIHTANGRYDDEPLRERPAFYGDTRYGRLNLKLLTDPSLRTTRWELLYLPALVSPEHAARVARPDLEGKPRIEIKPETIRTASASAIRAWAFQATPFDNVAAMLPVRELIGLMSFSFDLTLPGAQTIWEKTVERTEEELADLMFATPYRYTMRHRFPKPQGV